MAMSEWVTFALGLASIAGIIALIHVPLYLRQRRESRESHAELRSFLLESARSIRESRRESRRSHEDTKAFLKSMGIRLEQVFERVDDR